MRVRYFLSALWVFGVMVISMPLVSADQPEATVPGGSDSPGVAEAPAGGPPSQEAPQVPDPPLPQRFYQGAHPGDEPRMEQARAALEKSLAQEWAKYPLTASLRILSLPLFQPPRYPDEWMTRTATRAYTSLRVPEVLLSEVDQIPLVSPGVQPAWQEALADRLCASLRRSIIGNLDRLYSQTEQIRLGTASGNRENLEKQIRDAQAQLWVLNREGRTMARDLMKAIPLVQGEADLLREIPGDIASILESQGFSQDSTILLDALARLAEKQGVWWILLGSLEPFFRGSPYYSARVALYNTLENRIVYYDEIDGLLDEIPSLARERAYLPARVISGLPWAGISIQSIPRGGRIKINGEEVGIGSYQTRFLPPGTHEIEVSRQEFRSSRRSITVQEDDFPQLRIILQPRLIAAARIDSLPGEAWILNNSHPAGTAPGYVDLPSLPSVLTLGHQGYHPRTLVLTRDQVEPQKPVDVQVSLLDDRIDWEAQVKYKRDRLYGALGFTIVGVAVPLILNGFYDEAARTLQSRPDTQAADPLTTSLRNRANSLYTARNLGIGLAGASIVNAIVHIIDYGNAARLAQTR